MGPGAARAATCEGCRARGRAGGGLRGAVGRAQQLAPQRGQAGRVCFGVQVRQQLPRHITCEPQV
jgi:hypothetical protein